MLSFLGSIGNYLHNFLLRIVDNFEGDGTNSGVTGNANNGIFQGTTAAGYDWINTIIEFLNSAVIPMTITLLIAGALLIIFLSVLMVKAESSDDAKKYRKRIIGVGVTVFIVLILLYFIGFFLPRIPEIVQSIRESISPSSTTN